MLKRIWLLTIFILLLAALPALAVESAGESRLETSFSDNSWTYTLVHTITLRNSAPTPAYNINVTVPLMDEGHILYNTKLGEQLLPYPELITVDESGHRNAVYYFSSMPGGGELTLTQKYALDVTDLTYSFDRLSVADSYSAMEQLTTYNYTLPEEDIQSDDPRILAFAQAAVGAETDLYRQARLLFAAVYMALDYNEDAAADQSAIATLERGSAFCQGYVNLYIAALRSLGIAARELSGYLYMPARHISDQFIDKQSGAVLMNELRHVWVEYYLPDIGWVAADPTYTYTYRINGLEQKIVDWDYFSAITTPRRYIFYRSGSRETEKIRYSNTGGWLEEPQFSATLVLGKDYLPFNDINGHWAVESIVYSVERGLFNGVSPAQFKPDQAIDRAMFITVLGRLFEARGGQTTPYSSDISQFSDIRDNDYYARYLGWALDCQLTEGYGSGRFGPHDPITREQMAKMIADYLAMTGVDTYSEEQLLPFTDAYAISDWARPGVSYCAAAGLLTGQPNGTFQPGQQANRAQISAVLQRLDSFLDRVESSGP